MSRVAWYVVVGNRVSKFFKSKQSSQGGKSVKKHPCGQCLDPVVRSADAFSRGFASVTV